jgi:hypothetical protein
MEWVLLAMGILAGLFIIGFAWEQIISPVMRWLLHAPFWEFFWHHVVIGFKIVFIITATIITIYLVLSWLS